MRLDQVISNDLIFFFAAKNKEELLRKIILEFARRRNIPKQRASFLIEMLLSAEKISSTGLENGVALPHIFSDELKNPVAIVTISRRGVPFASIDGTPARIIVVVISPTKSAQDCFAILASLASILKHKPVRAALLEAKEPREVLSIIKANSEKC